MFVGTSKKKIVFITFGRASVPSVNFRLMIHKPLLEKYFDIYFSENYRFLLEQIFSQPDIIFIQKKQLPLLYWLLILIFFRSKVIYDFDDAIYLPPKKKWKFITKAKIRFRFILVCQLADLVLCPNSYLAKFAQRYNNNVCVLPMSVTPVSVERTFNGHIFFGWAGHPQSLHLLKTIEADIRKFQELTNNRNFLILCGQDPHLDFSYDWLPYSEVNQILFFNKVNVGVAPSRNTPFDQGKSPIKIIQHFAYGKTVVTNMRGGAEDIVNDKNAFIVKDDSSWVDSFITITNNVELVQVKSDQAFHDYNSFYSSNIVSAKLVDLIKSVLV